MGRESKKTSFMGLNDTYNRIPIEKKNQIWKKKFFNFFPQLGSHPHPLGTPYLHPGGEIKKTAPRDQIVST